MPQVSLLRPGILLGEAGQVWLVTVEGVAISRSVLTHPLSAPEVSSSEPAEAPVR